MEYFQWIFLRNCVKKEVAYEEESINTSSFYINMFSSDI